MKEKAEDPKRTFFVSFRVRLLVGFTLLFTVVFAGAYYWFYTYSTNTAIKRLEQDLRDTLNGAVRGVDADEFVALAKEGAVRDDGYTDDPRFWAHVDWLVQVSKVEPRAVVYSYIAGDKPKEVIFIGSIGAVENPPGGAKFKEHYVTQVEGSVNILTGLDHLAVKRTIYTDKWGSWMSAYGPIVNDKGEKIGAIGIDFRADYVKEVQQGILNSMVVAFAITYIILFTLVYVISILFTRPIVSLTRAARQIGDGDYDQNLSNLTKGSLRDEMSTLAGVFQIMVDKVGQREKSLRARVAQLEILIDRSKLETQVKEIVDSDFFQDLRSKVQDMRSRFKDGPTTDNVQEK